LKTKALILDGSSLKALRRYRAEALAGPAERLQEFALARLEGRMPMPPLRYGVIAFTRLGCSPLSEQDRELLWHAFQVPLFEQLRGPDGELLAAECEAHQGLHLHNGRLAGNGHRRIASTSWCAWSAWQAAVDETPCACGATAPRLVPVPSQRALGAGFTLLSA